MEVKELRRSAGMTQQAFSEKYQIPLQTLKQWESKPGCSAHREPPKYVVHMLARLVCVDSKYRGQSRNGRAEFLIKAAVDSRASAAHWMRYLRKEFTDGRCLLSEEDVWQVLSSDKVAMFQKVMLKRAVEPHSATNRFASSLNEPAKTPMLDEIRKRRARV